MRAGEMQGEQWARADGVERGGSLPRPYVSGSPARHAPITPLCPQPSPALLAQPPPTWYAGSSATSPSHVRTPGSLPQAAGGLHAAL